jgi:signal transduction histidine kinase
MRKKILQQIRNTHTGVFTGMAIVLSVVLTTSLNAFFSWISGTGIKPITMLFATLDAILIPIILAPLFMNLFKRAANIEDVNQQLQIEIAERQRAEWAAQQRSAQLQAINELALECAAASAEVDLPKLIADRFRSLTGVRAVSISTFDPNNNELTIRYISVDGGLLSALNKLLGRNVIGMTNPVSLAVLQDMLTNGISITESLSEVTFGAISPSFDPLVRATFGPTHFTAMALCYNGKLWGTTVAASQADQPPIERDLARAFANIAAVAMQRQNAERALHQRQEQLQAIIVKSDLAEIEREKLIAELEAKNFELERFTYTVSHDLKAPLITIRGFLGFVEKDVLAGDLARMQSDMQRITDATIKMERLLSELLELSRIGRLMNPPEAVPFESIVQDAMQLVEGPLIQCGAQVMIGKALPIVYADRVRLVEVVQNLLDNACKFMGEQSQPCIEIGAGEQAGKAVFFVRDNGIGIAPEYHEKIFGLFDKLDPRSAGTGIGLALVKRIIEVHHGQIWVESDGLGHGATFYFTIPACVVEPA